MRFHNLQIGVRNHVAVQVRLRQDKMRREYQHDADQELFHGTKVVTFLQKILNHFTEESIIFTDNL